ncbi:hypothetical protein B566_EDAN005074 [Ephemera danica]|nr:hypothetical protein B566_EDAN005074 [Ephemera danica]
MTKQSGCGSGTAKKKTTTFSRLLRGLKPHRKDKASSPTTRQRTPAGCNKSGAVTSPASRVGTPEGLCEAMVPTLLPSVTDIRDYDHLRFLQMNGGASGVATSFEETIQRLKMQEALKKKERFHKEQEEILRDIRHGLMQIGIEGGPSGGALNPFPGASDDTYMYDDDVRMAGLQGPPLPPLHWYDEPPYESDPEDFLMGGLQPPLGRPNAAIFQNGRVCFTLNLRSEPRGEGVISLRSAGDISLPRDGSWRGAPYAGMPPPSGAHSMTSRHAARHAAAAAAAAAGSRQRHAMQANRESGDYAGSDVQSVSSRLSTVSVETSRSEHEVTSGTVNAAYMSSPGVSSLIQPPGKARAFRTLVSYKARSHSRASMSEDGLSPCSHSSDYEEDELQITTAPSAAAAAIHAVEAGCRIKVFWSCYVGGEDAWSTSRCSEEDLSAEDKSEWSSQSSVCWCRDYSLKHGSSTQALVPAGSSHSLMSPDEGVPKSTPLPVIGKARALVDYNPSPYDKDALRFKKGDVIDVVAMNASGLWKGRLHNRVGIFKFINVELLTEARPGSAGGVRVNRGRYASRLRPSTHKRGRPKSVEELLHRMNMEAHISVFVLNGYEDLELFKELEEADLDFLGISHPEHRAKILTAVQLLHDYDSPESPDSEDEDEDEPESSTDGGHSSETSRGGHTSFQRRHFPRDSGCYASSSERPPRRGIDPTQRLESSPRHLTRASSDIAETPNNLDSTILEESGKKVVVSSPVRSTCSSPASVMAKKISAQAAMASALAAASLSAAQARRQETEEYHPNIPVLEHADPPDPTPLNAIIAMPTSAAGPRTPTFDFRAEYDKLRGKLEASLSRGSPIRIRKPEGGGEAIALRQLTSEMASARCFSEKSSDSGISSSSRSPPPPQNTNTSVATPQASNSAATSSPTRVFAAFGCGLDRKPGTPNMLTNIEKTMFQ